MMCICKFDDAFCGCSLKTVAQVILYITLSMCLVCFALNFSSPLNSPEKVQTVRNMVTDLSTGMGNEKEEAELQADVVVDWYETITLCVLAGNVILTLATSTALYGVYRNRPSHIILFLITGALMFFVWYVFLVAILAVAVIYSPQSFLLFMYGGLIFSLAFYLYLVVYNYYRVLKEVICSAGSMKYVT